MPQGSVLGPILLFVGINDLPEGLSPQVRLFADDTAVYMYLTVGGSDDGKDTFCVEEPVRHGVHPMQVPSSAGDNCQEST